MQINPAHIFNSRLSGLPFIGLKLIPKWLVNLITKRKFRLGTSMFLSVNAMLEKNLIFSKGTLSIIKESCAEEEAKELLPKARKALFEYRKIMADLEEVNFGNNTETEYLANALL